MRRRTVGLILTAVALGGLVMALARAFSGADPAATLASILGLGSGVVLGALLGGVFGAWLVLGGTRRVAETAGFLLGLAFVVGAWRLLDPYLWVVGVVLKEVFGKGGEQYSGLVLFLIAIPMLRSVAGAAAGLLLRLLSPRS